MAAMLLCLAPAATGEPPEQLHLAASGSGDGVVVQWGTAEAAPELCTSSSDVEYGLAPDGLNHSASGTWDTHGDKFPPYGGIESGLKPLLPVFDHLYSTLINDLSERGLLDEVLVIAMGEFGRTPSITKNGDNPVPGRGHWARCYTAVFAGGGVRGGQVIGKSDKDGGYPASTSYHPNDIGATIYHTLGVDPTSTIVDEQDRPIHLNHGKRLDVLYTG